MSDRVPEARISDARYSADEIGIEHLRFGAGVPMGALPGLDGPFPSLLRDAAALAVSAGVSSVDVVLARVAGARPWDLTHPTVLELLGRALGDTPGAVVAFPDANGPSPIGLDDGASDPAGLIATVTAYGPMLAEHFQLGVVDVPAFPDPVLFQVLRRIRGHDVCACMWTGPATALDRHGWRSGAGWLAGRIAASKAPMIGVAGHSAELGGGREVADGRRLLLGGADPVRQIPEFARDALVDLHVEGSQVTVRGEPTLRAPIGLWDVPLVRTAKILHQRIAITANLFVFRHATEENAILLQTALTMALQDFVKREVVTGLDGAAPTVHAVPDKNPAQPALIATVRAYLRPWLRELRIDLAVRPGEAAVVEVA